MRNALLYSVVSLAIAGVLAIGGMLWVQQQKADKLRQSATPSYGEALVADQAYGEGQQVLEAFAGSQSDFSQYQKYANEKGVLLGDLQKGEGLPVAKGTRVAINYKGYLTNGKLFSQTTDQPFAFTVGDRQVIPGMEQGVIGMKVGGKRRLVIPPSWGYGNKDNGSIPANSVLIFDIELVAAQ